MHLQSCEPVNHDAIGEVWISGPSIAQGYWQNEAATAAGFVSRNGKSWLRTGDLAFMHNGELFITGRLKDLILIRGQNLYPQDPRSCWKNTSKYCVRGALPPLPLIIGMARVSESLPKSAAARRNSFRRRPCSI